MYPEEPTITVAFEPPPGGGYEDPVFPPGEQHQGNVRVALVEHPAPMSRNRVLIALVRGDAEHAYEIVNNGPQGVVNRTLVHAGVKPKPKSSARIHRAADLERSERIMSFKVPAAVDEDFVAVSLEKLMLADTPSTYAVLYENCFHTAWGVFEELRERCGSPALVEHRHRNFHTEKPGDLEGASHASGPVHAIQGGHGAKQISGPNVVLGRKPAHEAVTRVLLDVPMVNQNTDFDWINGYAAAHPKDTRGRPLPTGGQLCGVAALRMYLWYFNGLDPSIDTQVGLIAGVYVRGEDGNGKGMGGDLAPPQLDARVRQTWKLTTTFAHGNVADIPPCIDRRYPVPVGVKCFVGTLDKLVKTSNHYDTLVQGKPHPHPHPYSNGGGHWAIAVGYEKKGKTLTAILVNDPDTGCLVKVPAADFEATFSYDGDVYRIVTEHIKVKAPAK